MQTDKGGTESNKNGVITVDKNAEHSGNAAEEVICGYVSVFVTKSNSDNNFKWIQF